METSDFSSNQPEISGDKEVAVIYRRWSTARNGKRVYPKGGKRALRIEIRK